MIIDIYCDKCQYLLGDNIKIIVDADDNEAGEYKLYVKHLGTELLNMDVSIGKIYTEIELGSFAIGGYEVCIGDKYTAFDVVAATTDVLRYGFLSEFYKDDILDEEDVKQLNKYHINIVQFYDWMYRHHDLIPKEDFYIDPLGRTLYKDAVINKIMLCHKYGMKALAYGAVYGAEKEYFENAPEQVLYKNSGEKFDLIDIIAIMNISEESPWHRHIINEFKKALVEWDFDGIHMDQYGFPKTAISQIGSKIAYLKEDFPVLINNTKEEMKKIKEDSIIMFNCVNNWPIENVAKSDQDNIYIEVWDPNDRYLHLADLIRYAKALSNNKNVILSAYMHPFNQKIEDELKENGALITMSVIFACGGNHLLLGEQNGALAEAYYVNYGKYRSSFEPTLRSYYDFIVKYNELLFSKSLEDISMTFVNGINDEVKLDGSKFSSDFKKDTVSVVLRENKNYKVLNLINLVGIEDEIWNKGKTKPSVQKDLTCTYLVNEEVEGVYFASPDIEWGQTKKLDYEIVPQSQGNSLRFIIPAVEIWSLIYIKTKA